MSYNGRPVRVSPSPHTHPLRFSKLTKRASARAGATGQKLASVLYRGRVYVLGLLLWLLGSLIVLLAIVGYAVGELVGLPGGLTAAIVVAGYWAVVDGGLERSGVWG